jgi:hypothetical protein
VDFARFSAEPGPSTTFFQNRSGIKHVRFGSTLTTIDLLGFVFFFLFYQITETIMPPKGSSKQVGKGKGASVPRQDEERGAIPEDGHISVASSEPEPAAVEPCDVTRDELSSTPNNKRLEELCPICGCAVGRHAAEPRRHAIVDRDRAPDVSRMKSLLDGVRWRRTMGAHDIQLCRNFFTDIELKLAAYRDYQAQWVKLLPGLMEDREAGQWVLTNIVEPELPWKEAKKKFAEYFDNADAKEILQERYRNCTQKPNESAQAYTQRFMNLCGQLGYAISDEQRVVEDLVQGLKPDMRRMYRQYVLTQELVHGEAVELSLSQVIEAVIKVSMTLNDRTRSGEGVDRNHQTTQPMTHKRSESKDQRQGDKPRSSFGDKKRKWNERAASTDSRGDRCDYCGKLGHKTKDCYSKKAKASNVPGQDGKRREVDSKRNANVKCYQCGKMGHIRPHCPEQGGGGKSDGAQDGAGRGAGPQMHGDRRPHERRVSWAKGTRALQIHEPEEGVNSDASMGCDPAGVRHRSVRIHEEWDEAFDADVRAISDEQDSDGEDTAVFLRVLSSHGVHPAAVHDIFASGSNRRGAEGNVNLSDPCVFMVFEPQPAMKNLVCTQTFKCLTDSGCERSCIDQSLCGLLGVETVPLAKPSVFFLANGSVEKRTVQTKPLKVSLVFWNPKSKVQIPALQTEHSFEILPGVHDTRSGNQFYFGQELMQAAIDTLYHKQCVPAEELLPFASGKPLLQRDPAAVPMRAVFVSPSVVAESGGTSQQ